MKHTCKRNTCKACQKEFVDFLDKNKKEVDRLYEEIKKVDKECKEKFKKLLESL